MLATQKHTAQRARRSLSEGGSPHVVSVEIFLYRAPEPRPLDDLVRDAFAPGPANPYRHHDVCTPGPGYSFHCDMLTLSGRTYPLCCHMIAFCFDLKSCVATCFEKKGGGGTPLSAIADLRQVFSDLIADLRSFPRGWSPRPDYDI